MGGDEAKASQGDGSFDSSGRRDWDSYAFEYGKQRWNVTIVMNIVREFCQMFGTDNALPVFMRNP